MIKRIWQNCREVRTRIRVNKLNNIENISHPCFSIVIPVYDRTWELRKAVESLLSQTFVNYEILLVCDGSPKETVEVVQSYLGNKRIRGFFFTDNSGNPCRGRNKGIQMAHGQYIAFLDSDDIAMPDRLMNTLYSLLLKKVDIVGGAIQYLTEGKNCREFNNGQIGFTSEECTYKLLLGGNRLSICTVAVKKNCLIAFGGFREVMRYREDHELWLRLAYRGCSFYNSSEIYAQYRVHDSNAELSYLEDDKHWEQLALKLHREPYILKEE